ARHLLDGGAGADAGRRIGVDRGRRVHVVARDRHGAGAGLGAEEGAHPGSGWLVGGVDQGGRWLRPEGPPACRVGRGEGSPARVAGRFGRAAREGGEAGAVRVKSGCRAVVGKRPRGLGGPPPAPSNTKGTWISGHSSGGP